MIFEGWTNHKDGYFTADMSELHAHARTGKQIHCPGCKTVLNFTKFAPIRDRENDTIEFKYNCPKCGAKLRVFNEETQVKLTFKQYLNEAGTLLEIQHQNLSLDEQRSDLMDEIHDILKTLETKYKSHEVNTSSVPAAPDTSKFRATVSGMIKLEKNVNIHYGVFTRTFKHFLKIGSGVGLKITKQIQRDFLADLEDEFGLDFDHTKKTFMIKCTDGTLIIEFTDGSSWGGIGAYL